MQSAAGINISSAQDTGWLASSRCDSSLSPEGDHPVETSDGAGDGTFRQHLEDASERPADTDPALRKAGVNRPDGEALGDRTSKGVASTKKEEVRPGKVRAISAEPQGSESTAVVPAEPVTSPSILVMNAAPLLISPTDHADNTTVSGASPGKISSVFGKAGAAGIASQVATTTSDAPAAPVSLSGNQGKATALPGLPVAHEAVQQPTPNAGETASGVASVVAAVAPAFPLSLSVPHGPSSANASAATPTPEHQTSSMPAQDHAILTASPNVLEVGVAAGTNGWLKVRAELGVTGEVAASVVASSAHAVDALQKDLPAITAYLAAEQVGIGSLSVARAAGTAGAQDAAMSFGQGAEQEAAGQSKYLPGVVLAGDDNPVSQIGGMMSFASPGLPEGASSGSGSWLSVRA